MKIAEMQTLGMSNKVHLCDSCMDELPDCDQEKHVVHGTGKGDDNISACSSYRPIETRNYEKERDAILEPIPGTKDALGKLRI